MDTKQMFLANNAKFFPKEKLHILKEKIEKAEDDAFMQASYVELKDPTLILIISLLTGSLGIDRFLIGDVGMGIVKLLTFGMCGILTIIDWFTIGNKTREINFNNFMLML